MGVELDIDLHCRSDEDDYSSATSESTIVHDGPFAMQWRQQERHPALRPQ